MNARWLEHARATLRARGRRAGGGREAVLEELARDGCLRGAQELATTLRRRGAPVSLTTVYRTLDLLHELGLVTRVDTGEQMARYEPIDPSGAHHHHTVCDRCGRVLAFADEPLETAIDRLADRLPFTVERHELVLHGTCRRCGESSGQETTGNGP